MERKDFFKKACMTGICACAGITAIGSVDLLAQDNSEEKKDDWRIGFMQHRFAQLVDNMSDKLTPEQRDELLVLIGKCCSVTSMDKWNSYNGNIHKALEDIEKDFAEKATYDEKTQIITIIGKKSTECFCPFAGKKNISKTFCNCSKGWQQNTFETISGKKAIASVDESVLRGGKRCSFTIRLI